MGAQQSQKLESIGQITGGVAHDFNNLLTPIVGTLDLLKRRGLPDARAETLVTNALEAAERARTLVQRLLAFARRQPLKVAPVHLHRCLTDLEPLLATSLGPQVQLAIKVDDGLPTVMADCHQFELALLNLAVNARDAMPNGGLLQIEADAAKIADLPHDLVPGPYVELRVSDTGTGMPPSVAQRAIGPFFSTKGLGRGTGLGLSMVHGLMAQLGGGMAIASSVGAGTTIRLWLRVTKDEAVASSAVSTAPSTAIAVGEVLLVDDESLVRAGTAQMLGSLGYEVSEAPGAEEALAMLESGSFNLLMTDHLMPGMSGTELARQVRLKWPDVSVLIISGYADVDDIAPDFPRLTKPFRLAELTEALTQLRAKARERTTDDSSTTH